MTSQWTRQCLVLPRWIWHQFTNPGGMKRSLVGLRETRTKNPDSWCIVQPAPPPTAKSCAGFGFHNMCFISHSSIVNLLEEQYTIRKQAILMPLLQKRTIKPPLFMAIYWVRLSPDQSKVQQESRKRGKQWIIGYPACSLKVNNSATFDQLCSATTLILTFSSAANRLGHFSLKTKWLASEQNLKPNQWQWMYSLSHYWQHMQYKRRTEKSRYLLNFPCCGELPPQS